MGDALERLRELPAESVQTCITSPPYWGLRDYGVEGQLGLEPSPEEYVSRLVSIFREVRRVLRPDATLWLNLGDSYSCGGKRTTGRNDHGTDCASVRLAGNTRGAVNPGPRTAVRLLSSLKPKDLVGIPWRVAFALQRDGWWLRSDIVWSKANPMPESVTDRPTKAHEYLFLLAKSERYFYDGEAIKEEAVGAWNSYKAFVARGPRRKMPTDPRLKDLQRTQFAHDTHHPDIEQTTRNRRTVWTLATTPFPGAHFAVMPVRLVEPCILAGTSAGGACTQCGAPWKRRVERESRPNRPTAPNGKCATADRALVNRASFAEDAREHRVFDDFYPACECGEQTTRPCLVLDPFCGAGTVGVVARKQGRAFLGVELNPDYAQMACERIEGRRSLRPA